MDEFLLASFAFLAVTFVGFGLFGRPNQSRPTCRSCNADVRPLAWADHPTCACGTVLDRPGAVRTRGRVRRPRLIWVGVLLAGATMCGWTLAASLAGTSLRWIDLVPFRLVLLGAESRWTWAVRSVQRRYDADALTDEQFASAVVSVLSLPPPIDEDLEELQWSLVRRWSASPVEVDRVVPIVSGLRIHRDLTQVPVTSDGRRTEALLIGLAPLDDSPNWLVRIDRVSVAGVDVPFTMMSPDWVKPSRILTAAQTSATISVLVPTSMLVSPADLLIEVTVARTPAAQIAFSDPLIDSSLPVDRWEVDVVGGPVTRVIALPAEGSSP